MNKYLLLFLLTLLTLYVLPPTAEAQTNQAVFIFSPNTGSFSLNDTIPVDLNVNSTNSTGITSVKAALTFDKDKLEVVSLDSSESSFSFQWEQSFDNTTGTISIQRSSPTPKLGENLITKITFQPKSTPLSGAATVGYDPNCFAPTNPTCLALKPDNTNILAVSNGASFTITQPTPTPTPPPSYGTPSYGTPSYGTPSYGTPDYGTPSYGTPSYGTPSSGGGKTGDLNGDGKVNIFDLSILLRNWNKSGTGDLNSDGKVNIFDLSIMLRNWGK